MRKVTTGLLFLMASAASTAASWDDLLSARDLSGDGIADAYYDTAQNITWLKDASYAYTSAYADALTPLPGFEAFWAPGQMTLPAATSWSASLNLAGTTGWRLSGANFEVNAFGEPCDYARCGLGSSEMSQLFYTLGNTSTLDITGPFVNIQPAYYFNIGLGAWRGSGSLGPRPGELVSETGLHASGAWAVHDGDVGATVAVPEPSTYALLLLGLGALGFAARRRTPR